MSGTSRNRFYDPATGSNYVWHQNHHEEGSGARLRAVANAQPTMGRWKTLRPIRQQATQSGLVFKLTGNVPCIAQHVEFLRFMDLSLRQTIYFFHAAEPGHPFEVELSDYEPLRKYAIRTARGEKYLWAYTMQLDVIAVLP